MQRYSTLHTIYVCLFSTWLKSSKSSSFNLVRLRLIIVRPQQLNKRPAATLASRGVFSWMNSFFYTRSCCDVFRGFWCIFKISHENFFVRNQHFFAGKELFSSSWSVDPERWAIERLLPVILVYKCSLLTSNVLQSRIYHGFVIRPWHFNYFRMPYCSCWCFSIIKYILRLMPYAVMGN